MSFNLGLRLVDKVQNKDGKYLLHFKTNREGIGNIDVKSVPEDDKEYTFLDSETDSMSCKVHVAIRDNELLANLVYGDQATFRSDAS